VWIIAPDVAPQVVSLVEQHLGVKLVVPAATAVTGPQIQVARMDYLGRCKPRDDGTSTASGFSEGSWSLIFPETVLRAWFAADPSDQPTAGPETLFQVLTVQPTADPDAIKKAYRQLARQWHPDVCREPDARERFERIQRAWEVLRDDRLRRKYQAGVLLEASQQQTTSRPRYMNVYRHDADVLGYRAPLRNGYVMLEGTFRVGQLVVSKILNWSDITRDDGKTMVSSWPDGATTFVTEWI